VQARGCRRGGRRRTSTVALATIVAIAGLLLLDACSSAGHSRASSATTSGGSATSTTVRPPASSTIAWSRLSNPLYGNRDHAVKDPALVATGGGWVALFSQVDAHGKWRVGIARSRDLTAWSPPALLPHDPATEGEASPDVVRAPDGTFVVTYQSFAHDRAGGQSKLYATITTDFQSFSAPTRLLANVLNAPTDRLIDPALVYSPAGLLLGFKVGTTDAGATQRFELARSSSGALTGPWQILGRPDITVYGDTIENYEFLDIAGHRALLATSNQLDRPELFELTGAASDPTGWLHWSPARELVVPQEAWNPGTGLTGATFEHANCAFLVGGGAKLDGFYYLVYGDSPSVTTFGGAGPAQLGIARSTDLVHWSVPPR
jgi:hypothetical protein